MHKIFSITYCTSTNKFILDSSIGSLSLTPIGLIIKTYWDQN